jgi:hypothetical protein
MTGLSHVRWLVADLEPRRKFYRDPAGHPIELWAPLGRPAEQV